jgi:predicted ATPase/DNA-binding SARP family transcriptional activator
MTTMTLNFLGTFSASRNGEPITHFRGDKVRALLAYLATEAERLHSRTSLAALLWPDRAADTALRNLSQTLLRLREALGDTAEESPLLTITRGAIGWRGEQTHVDVLDFARLARSVDVADLEQASALYRGEFLPGFDLPDANPFEEWLMLTRAQLEQQALTGLRSLTSHYLTVGQWARAADAARRQIALDRWREAAHRQLMRALMEGGDRAAALAQFERCRTMLADELGIEPDEETRILCDRILGHDPPPATPGLTPRPGLPVPLTPFLGRETELRALDTLRAQDDVRLLTLVGAGGMGKTRLALEAARDAVKIYPDGVVFVPLAPLLHADSIPLAIVRAIGVTLHGSDLGAALLRFLRGQHMLLILDNMEHLAGGAALVVAILEAAPGVRIIATSRQRLGVRGEQVFTVEGLADGAGGSGEVASPAARVFIQSARREQAGLLIPAGELPVVERIAALVRGMPLALEMAAARVGLLPLADIPAEIERSLDFLQADWADAAERQRSMRAVFEWSWQLLGEAERAVLGRLSVFRGGLTREAAGRVTGATLQILATLSHASLVRWHPGNGAGRYEMHELLRQFAAEQLDTVPGERERVEARHSAYYLALTEEAAAEYAGPRQVEWLDRIERDHDNIRVAQERLAERGEVELELRLVGAAVYFWFIRGYHTEGAERLLHTLAHPEAQAPTDVRARALNAAGYLQWVRGNLREAHALFTESVGIARALGAQPELAFGLCYLGTVLNAHREYAAAEQLLQESLTIWDALGNRSNMGLSLMFLGDAALGRHNGEAALGAFMRSAELFRETGNVSVLPYPLRRLGYLARSRHDVELATVFYRESMAVNREVGDRQGVAASLIGLAAVTEARGEPEHAARLLGAADALVESIQTRLLPFDQEESERTAEAVRGRLDATTFATAWAEGRTMTVEQAAVAANM